MERLFKLKELKTNAKTEVVAGMTTFMAMAYIIVVNPAILSSAGVPFNQVFTATIIAAVTGTLIMALFANYPIAIAPGMGLNAYFASVVATQGVSYQIVFGTVFLAGVIFLLLSLTKLREMLIESIPESLKHAITSGIGLFIAFLGLKMAGIVAGNKETLVSIGNLHDKGTILAIVGLFVTLILLARKIKGALFIGMLVTAIIGYFMGMLKLNGVVSAPPPLVFFDMDISGVFSNGLFTVVFAFLLVTIFDTTGTLIGVTEQAGFMKNGKLPRAKAALSADAIATTVGAALGTSPSTAYIESSTGVAAGGRSGLTALTTGTLILAALFFSPLVSAIASLPAITAPALIIVGCYMMEGLAKINWRELDEAFPAFITILAMPLTSSIATGIALGFITYPIIKLVSGKGRSVHALIYVFGILFAVQLFFFS
ncbi:NCS2 family permease [Bacillus sp. FJAT-27445]|uniref:NCS2 family permease n=1 Tax=Bacillus sp. FJAT-27445 TaxID=1679166 RepID=UPI000AAD02A2|nr:NCS2 family permease [Bacillus sp. FJAT-27445]